MMGHTCDLSTEEAKARPEGYKFWPAWTIWEDPVSNEETKKQNQRVATLLYKPCVLVSFLLGESNTLTKKQLGREEFSFSLPLQVTVQSGEKPRQEPELIASPYSITSDHRTHPTAIEANQEPREYGGYCLLTGSASFLTVLKTIYLGMVLPTVGRVLLYQLTTKITTDMSTDQSDLGISSMKAFLSDNARLCQIDS